MKKYSTQLNPKHFLQSWNMILNTEYRLFELAFHCIVLCDNKSPYRSLNGIYDTKNNYRTLRNKEPLELESKLLLQKTDKVNHPERIKVSIAKRTKVSHLQRVKVSH